jgi:Leucine-rich repeat (LRR) protein
MKSLRTLYLWQNQLGGPLPRSLGQLANLKHLELQRNNLVGTLPRELGDLNKLTVLLVHDNELKVGDGVGLFLW